MESNPASSAEIKAHLYLFFPTVDAVVSRRANLAVSGCARNRRRLTGPTTSEKRQKPDQLHTKIIRGEKREDKIKRIIGCGQETGRKNALNNSFFIYNR